MTRPKYTLRDSPFFRLRSKDKLARILQVSPAKLKKLAQLENGYIQFQKNQEKGRQSGY